MFNRFYAVFKARNLEFWRDRSALGWNLAFPFLLVFGFAFAFSGDDKASYKFAIIDESHAAEQVIERQLEYVEYVYYSDLQQALQKLNHHQVDIVFSPAAGQYWVNKTSSKGYFSEKLLLSDYPELNKQTVDGRAVRYLDWVLPGILGMNMMFSCLFGVGYVIVRYRKNAVLKRLKATPLLSFEFIAAQVLSRMLIVMAISSFIFVCCDWLFDFYMLGSYWLLVVVAILGALSLVSMGLLVASRSRSEELTGGLLNLVSWPMMMFSGVWFSLEGSPDPVQWFAFALPLTHVLDAARAVMLEGAGLAEISTHLGVLLLMSATFMVTGSILFRWEGDGR